MVQTSTDLPRCLLLSRSRERTASSSYSSIAQHAASLSCPPNSNFFGVLIELYVKLFNQCHMLLLAFYLSVVPCCLPCPAPIRFSTPFPLLLPFASRSLPFVLFIFFHSLLLVISALIFSAQTSAFRKFLSSSRFSLVFRKS